MANLSLLTPLPLQFVRQYSNQPILDMVFTTAERTAYLTSPRRYAGQIVADTDLDKVFFLNAARDTWIEVGTGNSSFLTAVITNDSQTVHFTGDGATVNTPLVANVQVSTQPNNGILTLADGLYYGVWNPNGIVYGGIVTWISGYMYNVSAAGYYINGVFYTSPSTDVTLDPADNTFNRIDVFTVTTLSTVEVLTGIPSMNPQKPTVTNDKLELSFVLVEAGTTEPAISNLFIYQEDVEWTTNSTDIGRINPDATNSPFAGSVDIEATDCITGDFISFTNVAPSTIANDFTVLTFKIKSKGWNDGQSLNLSWSLNVAPVGNSVNITNIVYGFDVMNTTLWQTVSIPLVDFGILKTDSINRLIITANDNTSPFGWYIDDIQLQNTAIFLPSPAWTLKGNVNTDPLTDFLGTVDPTPLNFRINNLQVAYFGLDSNIVLGLNSTISTGTDNIAIGSNISSGSADSAISLGDSAAAVSNQLSISPNIQTLFMPGLPTGMNYVLTDLLGDGNLTLQPSSTTAIGLGSQSFRITFSGAAGTGQVGALTIPTINMPEGSFISEILVDVGEGLASDDDNAAYITIGIQTDNPTAALDSVSGNVAQLNANQVTKIIFPDFTEATGARIIVAAVGGADINSGSVRIILITSDAAIPVDGGGGGDLTRFGIEDILGIQDRAVDMQNFSLSLSNLSFINFQADTDNTEFNLGANLISMFSQFTGTNNFGQVIIDAGDGDTIAPSVQIYAQDDSLNSTEIFTQPTTLTFQAVLAGADSRNLILPFAGLTDGETEFMPVSVNNIFADSNGNINIVTSNPVEFQVNGVDNDSQILFNLIDTTTISFIDDLSGSIEADLNISTQINNGILTFADGIFTPNAIKNGIIFGGMVTWSSGYTYEVTACGYYLNSIFYLSPAYTVANGNAITLASPDGTFDRIDVFYVDNTSTVKILQGIPSATPSPMSLNAGQLELSFALVETGTTQPTLNTEQIYLEDLGEPTEWTATTNASGRIALGSLITPIQGTKSINATLSQAGDTITLTNDVPLTVSNLTILTFKIEPKALTGKPNQKTLRLSFRLGGTLVGNTVNLSNGNFGYNITSQTIQTISIPLTTFGMGASDSIDNLFIQNTSSGTNKYGFFLDDIKLQGVPVINPTPTGGRFAIEDNLGLVDRAIDMQAHSFTMSNSSAISLITKSIINSSTEIVLTPTTMQFGLSVAGASFRNINATFAAIADGSSKFLPLSVNGTFADSNGNITIATGGSQNLQQTTDIGNQTTDDIEITIATSGIILKAPTGELRYRITVNDAGVLETTSI